MLLSDNTDLRFPLSSNNVTLCQVANAMEQKTTTLHNPDTKRLSRERDGVHALMDKPSIHEIYFPPLVSHTGRSHSSFIGSGRVKIRSHPFLTGRQFFLERMSFAVMVVLGTGYRWRTGEQGGCG